MSVTIGGSSGNPFDDLFGTVPDVSDDAGTTITQRRKQRNEQDPKRAEGEE